uniref:heparosan-N-sulfate-glucuronate 5-epimerase n=1 Tax=Cacopsylla melanoneura TaxID=428564 RepID=A0A8D8W139_9HEMI
MRIIKTINLRTAVAFLCLFVCLGILFTWPYCTLGNNELSGTWKHSEEPNNLKQFEDISCQINGDYSVKCKKLTGEVYVPFTFLHKYFDVSGKIVKSNINEETFEWAHCNARIYYPKTKYDPKGVFAYFDNYSVENRDRVKCVSAIEGVPITTQWDPAGYYYPTQIAQYGLAHYSKNLTEPEPRRRILEDGDGVVGEWSGGYAGRQYNEQVNSYVFNFHTSESRTVSLPLSSASGDYVLSVTLSILSNSSLSVHIDNTESGETYRLHYVCSKDLLNTQGNDFYYGIGCSTTWQTLTRDIINDVQKGVYLHVPFHKRTKLKLMKSKLKIISIHLYGSGSIDNLTLSSSDHMAMFYNAAQWLVTHQDNSGGWPTLVTRHITGSGLSDLQPGWYSAMGQGHAISVLSRAYHHSGNPMYLNAALKGLKVFRVPVSKGGVLSKFLDKVPWYEEYPTTPCLSILNGFIYSLIGLYDLVSVSTKGKSKDVGFLYEQGMSSLKRMLSLYDTGSGSFYDLRHVTLGIAPKIARCDYHATHVNQLLLLATIDNNPILASTAERWAGYVQGKRASHN